MMKYSCGVKCIYVRVVSRRSGNETNVGGGVNVQQFRDGVLGEGVCFPLFHCFFEVYVISKCSF